jgi:hypothetical protein
MINLHRDARHQPSCFYLPCTLASLRDNDFGTLGASVEKMKQDAHIDTPTPTERDEAIRLLVAKIPKETLANILMLMQNKQTPWHHASHFGLGLQVRNALRECDRLTDAELVDRLTSIKGVGRFTANCRYFGAVKRLDGAVRVDTMLVNDTEWPAIVAGVSHMGNVG